MTQKEKTQLVGLIAGYLSEEAEMLSQNVEAFLKPNTNGDRIREMSDLQLACTIYQKEMCMDGALGFKCPKADQSEPCGGDCIQHLYNWMQQEVCDD